MRAVSVFRLAILSALLMMTALMVYLQPGRSAERTAKEPLRQAFAGIGGWRPVGSCPIDLRIVEELKLDDYLSQSYGRDKGGINLYIGYYRTAKKVGAAHDPLVCFQGQGWQIVSRESGEYSLTRDPALKISYSAMIAQHQDERELILYWFQANGKAVASTHAQKFALFLDKLSGKGGDNAFVRISAPIGEETPETVRQKMFEFIEGFYPDFYRYVTRT